MAPAPGTAPHDTDTTRTIQKEAVSYHATCTCGWKGPTRPSHAHTMVDRMVHLEEVG